MRAMTSHLQVLDAIEEEARREADAYCNSNGISKMSVGWSAYRKATIACKRAEWERERWIPVQERLPKERTLVLVFAPEMDESLTCMYYDPNSETAEFGEWVSEPSGPARGVWSAILSSDVTHWKPLPSPPDNK